MPNKVKVYVWRILKNGLAVGEQLHHRTIKEGVLCVACGYGDSLLHHFWRCHYSKVYWRCLQSDMGASIMAPRSSIDTNSDLAGWLRDWLGQA